MTVQDPRTLQAFPNDAQVKLRLYENKCSETISFGTIDKIKQVEKLKNDAFSAPSCQLRIVANTPDERGRLLGSTDTWTLRAKEPNTPETDGILTFQKTKMRPQIWKIEFRDDEYPIVYVDESIPNSTIWVRNDPIFVGCVLPAIVRRVFEEILQRHYRDIDVEWMQKWLQWASDLTGGTDAMPPGEEEREQQELWIDEIVERFCEKHSLAEMVRAQVVRGTQGATI
ncbi:MAG: hypothetical protein OXG99_02445 [Alphaproteobacteria bacterium]|nr:hypothetical protein [Alphaproteobacteria bacterium]